MTDREEAFKKYVGNNWDRELREDAFDYAWQARGKLDAVRIKELKDEIIGWRGKSIEREQHLKIANSAVEALSLQVRVLREALEVAKYSDNTTAVVDAAHNALNTTPSTDDWIRKDTLECEGTDRSGTVKLYRIKETE